MQKRLFVFLLVLGVVSVAALGTFYGKARVNLSHDPNDVDHVALYQNGLAAISLVRSFESSGGDMVLTFFLPTTTIFDSITMTGAGVTVKELRSGLASNPVLRPGDELIVHLEDGLRLQGTLVSAEGSLLLQAADGTSVIQPDRIVAVEVKGRAVDPAEAGSSEISILVSAAAGPHTVRLSYLAQGAGWNANHILDPVTGAFTFFATLTGLQDWQNVTLDLIAGKPNVVYAPTIGRAGSVTPPTFSMTGLTAHDTDYADAFQPSTALGDLHKYHFPGTVSFERGETVRLPVVSGSVAIVRHYYDASGARYQTEWSGLPEKYELRNTLTEPIPAGPVRMFIDGQWIGADNLGALGIGERGNVTAAMSGDVKARTRLESETKGPITPNGVYGGQTRHVTSIYDLQIRNLRTGADAAIDLRATFNPDNYRVTSSSANPPVSEMLGTLMVWNKPVAGGETVHFRITVEWEENV